MPSSHTRRLGATIRTRGVAAVLGAVTLLGTTALPAHAAVRPHAATSTATGGMVLDLYGGLHSFGGAAVETGGAPSWSGFDIARSVSVAPGGGGGWTLDGYGGVHQWGYAPAVGGTPYWGWDIGRALVVLPDSASGYVLDGYGGLHAFGPHAPAFTPSATWPGFDIARGLAVTTDGNGNATGGYVLDGYGGLHPFGAAPVVASPATSTGGRDVWQRLHFASDGTLYAVGRYGIVSNGVAASWSGYSDWGAGNVARDVVLFGAFSGAVQQPASWAAQQAFAGASAQLGGVTLDVYGGLHLFGGASLNMQGMPYWPGFAIARSVAAIPSGAGGWTLDGFGGVHQWGAAAAVTGTPYWGWDIARGLAVLPDGHSGYVVDGFGGIHAFGAKAPAFAPSAYWPGFDIARGVAVNVGPDGTATGGWVLDGYGSLHPFGNVPAEGNPATYYAGHAAWLGVHQALDGTGLYTVGRFGIVDDGALRPLWTAYSDFGGADLLRDTVLFNPVLGGGAQPVSPAAADAFFLATQDGLVSKPGCGAYGITPPPGQYIVISLACQEMSAYQDGVLVADTLTTTGRPALQTQRGHTSVLRKNHPWLMVSTWPPGSQYYYYPSWVQYVVWIWPNGTGIHDASWEPDSALGPGSENGAFASHGCIHVTLGMAAWVYNWANIGTPVDVV